MLESEDFEAVSKKYREIYNQMKNSIIKLDGNKPFILNGTYAEPTDEKRFMASSFNLVPAAGELKSLRVELTHGISWLQNGKFLYLFTTAKMAAWPKNGRTINALRASFLLLLFQLPQAPHLVMVMQNAYNQ